MAMKPEEALRAIAAARGDALCVPTMTTAPAWRTIAPDDLSVACVGFMGGASSLGLGLALARPDRRVLVFDGDGSLLMQLGSLATVAGAAPRNLVHSLLRDEGPILVELHTGLADKTPMTDRGGVPFAEQVERLRGRLIAS
jgi:phosphonopyruvate decarboxylase